MTINTPEGIPSESHEVLSVKMTDWANEPSLSDLKGDFESAKEYHTDKVAKIENWNNLLHVEGQYKPKKIKGRSSVQPKLIRKQAEWRYPALSEPFLSSNKLFKVTPVTFEDEESAKQNELVLSWQFRTKIDRVKLIDDYVRSACDDGTAILQVGWEVQTKTETVQEPVFNHYEIETEEQGQILQQALEMKQANIRGFNDSASPEIKAAVEYYEESGIPTYAELVGYQEVEKEVVIENRPTVDVLDPANVIIDPSCNGNFDRALFVISMFETNKADLEKIPGRYKNLDQINWTDASTLTETDYSTKTPDTFAFKDQTRKKAVAYEYWGFYDIHNDGTLVPFVATWIGNTLIRMEISPFPDEKLPFVLVSYLPRKRDLYGEPDAELLGDNQRILGAVTRGMIDLLGRSANSQQGMAKGALDPVNLRRFREGEDYEYNPNQSYSNGGLIQHKFPEIPRSAIELTTMVNQESEAYSGVKAFSGGISGSAYGDVATGIRGALDAASKREMNILRRLAKGLVEVGKKIIAMNSEFLSEEEVVRVTNKQYVVIKREDLKGNFDLDVDIATAEVDNAKSQDLAFMLQTIGPNLDPRIPMKILAKIADLKRMPDLAEELATWQPEPDPLEQELRQLEIEKARMEIQVLQSEALLNQARARKEQSQSNKTDLDFVEQETGTAHERELEKQKAQARGNQNYAITKALTEKRKPDEQLGNIEAAIGFNQLSDMMEGSGPRTPAERDVAAEQDPRLNINSPDYDPSLDPATNPGIGL